MSTTRKALGAVAAFGISIGTMAAPAVAAPRPPNVHPYLLRLSEMPSGWSVTPGNFDSSGGPAPACAGHTVLTKPGASAGVGYDNGTDALLETLGSWPTASAAHHWFTVASRALGRCHQFSMGGQTATFVPLNLGSYGNASVAFKMNLTDQGNGYDLALMIAQKGRVVAVLGYIVQDWAFDSTAQDTISPMFQQAMAQVRP